MAHVFKAATIFLTLLAATGFPQAVWDRIHTRRTWLIIGVVELQFVGSVIAIADAWNKPVVWWRTPRIFLVAVLALIYIEMRRRDTGHRI